LSKTSSPLIDTNNCQQDTWRGPFERGNCHEIEVERGVGRRITSPFAGTARADTTVLFDGTFNDITAAPIFTEATGANITATVCVSCGNPRAAIQGVFV
jgi:hypothetical protein